MTFADAAKSYVLVKTRADAEPGVVSMKTESNQEKTGGLSPFKKNSCANFLWVNWQSVVAQMEPASPSLTCGYNLQSLRDMGGDCLADKKKSVQNVYVLSSVSA